MAEAQPNPAPLVLRLAYAAAVLAVSWYVMMAVHELGHALAAIATGGGVERIVLPLLGFSRTDIAPNPQPLGVAWAGPIAGVVLPVLLFMIAKLALRKRCHLAQQTLCFFAGLCLLSNGVYLGLGWLDRVGDAGDLLRHGASVWQLIVFGALSSAAGLWFWHRLGPWLGLASPRDAHRTAAP
ncbi:M50 family metallopeptidase [Phycisphaeraceae bacterium D3-23]